MTLTAQGPRVILITGPSGAGRSTAINALEDLGYETIDNIPLALVPRLLDGPSLNRPLVLGLDVRNRQFSVQGLVDLKMLLARQEGLQSELVYLDCARDVLVRRFSETRRRHPLAPDGSATQGIDRELELLAPVKDQADVLLMTTELTPHELRAEVQTMFGPKEAQILAVSVQSFSYKRGLPHGADLVFDCRFLNNPYWEPELRAFSGLDAEVSTFVARDLRYDSFLQHIMDMVTFLLPAFQDEGKAHLSVAFGCTGGQHRSVTVAETVARGLAHQGWRVSIRHRELERRGLSGATSQLLASTGEKSQ